ncbi:MAG: STAS/SEC14 domain-containing protein [Pseudomonadota bacterium]
MFRVFKPSENRLNIELSGALDKQAMRFALDKIMAQSEDITNGKMLYRIVDFDMPTLGAIVVEIQYFPKLLRLIAKFDKCAVQAETDWIRTAAEIEGAIIPSLEIKAFPLSAAATAEAWLRSSPDEVDHNEEEDENFPV